jgi:hypothetical protein
MTSTDTGLAQAGPLATGRVTHLKTFKINLSRKVRPAGGGGHGKFVDPAHAAAEAVDISPIEVQGNRDLAGAVAGCELGWLAPWLPPAGGIR